MHTRLELWQMTLKYINFLTQLKKIKQIHFGTATGGIQSWFFCMSEDINTCMCRTSTWWKLTSKWVQKQHKYDGNQHSVLLLLPENLRGNIPSLFFPQALCIILIRDTSKQIKVAGELLQMSRYITYCPPGIPCT